MRPFIITALVLFFSSLTLFSQKLTGYVLDEYQKPLQEVNILNKANMQHTHSNSQGYFVFDKVAPGDSLQFFHLGYDSKMFVVTDLKRPIEITLQTKLFNLEEVVIAPNVNALHVMADIDIQTNPVNSSQDILRKVPGLMIGQHAGGGKAEQMFLRGFDLDHGTDINITVDGLPVNMVSHAHGQGYADLHFVIPETIDKIDFGKGPYYENKGNFTTAGYVNFISKQKLENNSIKLEAGQFDSYRLLGMFKMLDEKKHNAYLATEYLSTDGPFESPQNFNRVNLMAKYQGMVSATDRIGISASVFTSKWDASGQIPQRAVDNGVITRFGAIDDTEGGLTSRNNLLFKHDKIIDDQSRLSSSVYLIDYDFELYSNFTFFLEDSINGDEIKQKEERTIYGLNSEYQHSFSSSHLKGSWRAGISLRNDRITDNELSHTANRLQTLNQIKFGNINETNFGAYMGADLIWNKWTLSPALRFDYFDFQYNDALSSEYETLAQTKAIVSPKFNLMYNKSQELQYYLKTGKGFHSNDTRVVVAQEGEKILPAAYSINPGMIWKAKPKMLINIAYWYLYLEQEFVYVGDAGIVEPSGETRRQGIDLSYRYQPMSWLFWSLDANYTLARAIGEPAGQDYIPLAPDFTLMSSMNVIHKSGIYGSMNLRYLDDRPANEDNSIVAKGYTMTDLNFGYKWNKVHFGIQIQNLFNTEWNETQFATESRLKKESESVEEIHFTPGTPFFLKTMIQYNF